MTHTLLKKQKSSAKAELYRQGSCNFGQQSLLTHRVCCEILPLGDVHRRFLVNLLSLTATFPISLRYHGDSFFRLFCVDQRTLTLLLWGLIAAGTLAYFILFSKSKHRILLLAPTHKKPSRRTLSERVQHKRKTYFAGLSLASSELEKLARSLSCIVILVQFFPHLLATLGWQRAAFLSS